MVRYCNHYTRILYPPTEEKGIPWMWYWIKSMQSTLSVFKKNGCLFPFREKNVTPILCFWWSSSQEFIMMVWNILWYTLRRYSHNWRGAWNKVLSESFCNVKFSLIFSSKYKVIWKESMAIDQKSLKAFFHHCTLSFGF